MKVSAALAGIFLLFLSGLAWAGSIDLNSADAEMIADGMVGVGPKKAVEIVRYREANGPFQRLDELTQVKGIGPQTVEQNRGRVVVVVPESP